jgi:KUP system potassium uptake protein
MTPDPDSVPHALLHSLKHYKTLHEQVVILSVRSSTYLTCRISTASKCIGWQGTSRQVIVQYGFKDEPDIPAALSLCAAAGWTSR